MDLRLDHLMFEIKLKDTGFKEKPFMGGLFGGIKYTQEETRNVWFEGIRHGIEIGLRKASLSGQIIEINNNIQNPKEKEFYDEYIKLAQKYDCAIQYHPKFGMKVVNVEYGFNSVVAKDHGKEVRS